MRRFSRKELGEAVEARFLDAAVFFGFIVAKVWGESRPFDFYVAWGNGDRPYRVQVKASCSRNGSGYQINCMHTGTHRPYTPEETDFIAAYVVPARAWYIVPVRAVSHVTTFTVFPRIRNSRSKYERYREQWDLLRR
jgi:hypothetical protein